MFCTLPYRFVVPLPIRETEVRDFSAEHWKQLDVTGMVTHDLTPHEVGQALALKERYPGLFANDCFGFVTARVHSGILLTGDALLRKAATKNGLRARLILVRKYSKVLCQLMFGILTMTADQRIRLALWVHSLQPFSIKPAMLRLEWAGV